MSVLGSVISVVAGDFSTNARNCDSASLSLVGMATWNPIYTLVDPMVFERRYLRIVYNPAQASTLTQQLGVVKP